jgi:hypothetical protein
VQPLFTIYSKAFGCECEAKESALIRALIYIYEELGYKIGDLNYVQYLLQHNPM